MQNGPMMGLFEIREDIMQYKEKVYQCMKDERETMFFVIVGWGEENGAKFWLCLSARGESFGEQGVIKMKMGSVCPKLGHAMTCEPNVK